MAIGLKFEKKEHLGKAYTDITDCLKIDELLGKLTLREVNPLFAFEDDMDKPQNPDGSRPRKSTGEILGIVLDLLSTTQSEILKFSVVGVSLADFEALGIKFNDTVKLSGVHVCYYAIPQNGNRNNNGYIFFADGVSKAETNKNQAPTPPTPQSKDTKSDDKK
ncbi:hypothetical protein FACS1894192_00650 [Bacilli bacterium]|nr:hypothetical protein FACS1894192_00650 [Bacilli bacterium]